MDIFLLVGQSNMAGRGALSSRDKSKLLKSPPSSRSKSDPNACRSKLLSSSLRVNGHEIFSLNEKNEWITARHPLHYDKPQVCGIGPGLAFAKLIATLDCVDTNRKIGLIPCAFGGSSINEWLPTYNTRTKTNENNNKNKETEAGTEAETDAETATANTTVIIEEHRRHSRNTDSEFETETETETEEETESETETETETETEVETSVEMKSDTNGNVVILEMDDDNDDDNEYSVKLTQNHNRHRNRARKHMVVDQNNLFARTVQKTLFAIESDPDFQLRGLLWHQGESDCNSLKAATVYQSKVVHLFESFREWLNDSSLPILVGGLGDFLSVNPQNLRAKTTNDRNFMYYSMINETLKDLPQRLHNIAYVPANKLGHKGDYLHFDSESANIFGNRYALEYAKVSGSMTAAHKNYHKYERLKTLMKYQTKKYYQQTREISLTKKISFVVIASIACVVGVYAYNKYKNNTNNNKGGSDVTPKAK